MEFVPDKWHWIVQQSLSGQKRSWSWESICKGQLWRRLEWKFLQGHAWWHPFRRAWENWGIYRLQNNSKAAKDQQAQVKTCTQKVEKSRYPLSSWKTEFVFRWQERQGWVEQVWSLFLDKVWYQRRGRWLLLWADGRFDIWWLRLRGENPTWHLPVLQKLHQNL